MEHKLNNELRHYGVVGMKWGVRRASKQLSKATTDEARKKAVATLQKHRTKATNKIAKLEKQHTKLEKSKEARTIKSDLQARKMKANAARYKSAAVNRILITDTKRQKLMMKSMKLDVKADKIIAKSESIKAQIEKNEVMQKRFNQGISSIDQTLVEYGRKLVNG